MINCFMVSFLMISALMVTVGTPFLYAQTNTIEAVKKTSVESLKTFGSSRLKKAKVGQLTHKGRFAAEGSEFQKAEIHGMAKMDKTTVKGELKVFGPLRINGCEVGSINVNGPCKLKKSKIGKVSVNGPVKIDGTEISEGTKISGPLMADDAIFKQQVDLEGPLKSDESKFGDIVISVNDPSSRSFSGRPNNLVAVFDESSAKSLTIKGKSQEGRKLVVVLKDGTQIEKVTFDGGEGLVIADSDSTVGEIVGGEMKDKRKRAHRKRSREDKARKMEKKQRLKEA